MNLVLQEHARGCGYAVTAMVLGCSYAEAVDAYRAIGVHKNPEIEGLSYHQIDHLLAGRGVALARRYKVGSGNLPTEPWPPAPFAEHHLCQVVVVRNAPCSHFVVMRADGSCLDPLRGEVAGLRAYHDAHWVAGLARLAPLPPR